MTHRLKILIMITILFVGGCASTSSTTSKSEKQQKVLQMKDQVLTQLFKEKRDTRS